MRQAIVNYEKATGQYLIGFILNHEVVGKHAVTVYHDLTAPIVNWLVNGEMP